MNTTLDHNLFLALNFDGGAFLDGLMLAVSGKLTWVPLYLMILWLVWRRFGWRNLLLFIGLAVLGVVLTDWVAGIFKHSGPLKNLLPDLAPRLRPMYTPELEGLVHVIKQGGQYGTISAHAATTCSVALLSACLLRRWWFTIVAVVWVLLVCYSRIYLAYHFPLDILYGLLLGAIIGLLSVLTFNRLAKSKDERAKMKEQRAKSKE